MADSLVFDLGLNARRIVANDNGILASGNPNARALSHAFFTITLAWGFARPISS